MLVKLLLVFAWIEASFCTNLQSEELQVICGDVLEIDDENSTFLDAKNGYTSIRFLLLTDLNQTVELNSTNLSLLNNTNPTKLIIHGLHSYDNQLWVDQIVSVYQTNGNYNLVAVQWNVISTEQETFLAEAVNSVGQVVGIFLLQFTQAEQTLLSDVHLIGSSLGAQISGVAGETVAQNGSKVGRITGLDPTIPNTVDELDEDDAQFVDAIHTSLYYGEHRSGHIDFYVVDTNGNPICENGTCSELIASQLYITSIEDKDRYEGLQCLNETFCYSNNSAIMGEFVSTNISGQFLVTKDGSWVRRANLFVVVSLLCLYFIL